MLLPTMKRCFGGNRPRGCVTTRHWRYVEVVVLSAVVTVSWCAISSATIIRLLAQLQSDNTTQIQPHFNNRSENLKSNNVNLTVTSCTSGFYWDNSTGRCEADCGEWSALSEGGTLVWVTPVITVLNALQVIGAGVVVVLAFIHWDRILKYPTCFIVYSQVIIAVCWMVILVSYSDGKTLFCSSKSLRETLQKPTGFCSFQGAVIVSGIISVEVFEMFHAGAILGAVKFPFLTKRLESRHYTRYIHLTAILLAALLSSTMVVLQNTVGGGYRVDSSLTYCRPSDEFAFFTVILPMNAVSGVVVTLLVLTFWDLIKAAYRRYVKSQEWPKHFTNIQLKVLLNVTYIFFFSIAYLLSLGCCQDREDSYRHELNSYLECESGGVGEQECSRAGFEKLDTRILLLPTSLIAIGYPVVDMVYILSPRSRKKAGSIRRVPASYNYSTRNGVIVAGV